MKLRAQLLLPALLFLSAAAAAQPRDTSGNHPSANAEAWTWMGHVHEVQLKNGRTQLSENGTGFIYYYTRSKEPQMGHMVFRSTGLTTTQHGRGTDFVTHTTYAAKFANGELRARTGRLDLQFTAGKILDQVYEAPMTAKDQQTLSQALTHFEGLSIPDGVTPRKTVFQITEATGEKTSLVFYSIWPSLSTPSGQMRFLGQDGTFSFSEPMLVTTGKLKGKEVLGLSFLDRQWAPKSFGTFMMSGLSDLLKYGRAMNYAHSWSAFQAQNKRTREWSFFHLWRQWRRTTTERDQLNDYSGLLWMTNGTQSGLTAASDYSWSPSGFVLNQGREVMMDYTNGRAGFFPMRADFASKKMDLRLSFYASPMVQILNQPIPFYEGYAEGEGTWKGDPITIRGRLESSRLMFRDQDYQEMLEILRARKDGWDQPELQRYLKDRLADQRLPFFSWIHERLQVLASTLSELDLKLAVLKDVLAGRAPRPDPQDASVTIY